ncbi:hypothetical protein AB0M48_11850 [Lentzea sp. NPDC051208]|uniref:hypothetical protein n=1 Tax=Lentzea sp. NPDC051208 TaxID=3154642 RepID=UPI00343D013F
MSLVVLLGGPLASAAFTPDSGTAVSPAAAAQPAPPTNQPPLPIPTVDPDPCGPGSPPLPICTLPTQTTTSPTTPSTPCSGEGCIPQPGTTTTPPINPGTGQPGQGQETENDCGITDIGACITEAINAFFRGIVTEALNPLLDLLSKTLLTTPMPDSLPRVGELWDNSWQILLISYGLLVLIAGVIAMGYQTVQTRHSIKELAPRLVVGFLAGALSLWVATKGIQIANAGVEAIMGGGVEANAAGEMLRNLVLTSLNGSNWISFIGIVFAALLVALLVTYVVRVALTIILIAGAPLVLMFHALPQTEGIAYWWWKAYGGCLAIQLGQSLTLITAMKVFLAPGGFTIFGPTTSGLVNILVALALTYILFKIPFWVLSSVRGGGLIGSLIKGFLAYKTFGLFRGGGGGPKPRPSGGGRGGNGGGGPSGGGSPNPYANARTTANGQYVLPLPGVRRTRPTGKPTPKTKAGPAPKSSGPQGRQLALPLGDDWPENKPVLGRDGQYRLPLDVQRTTPPPAPPAGTDAGGRRSRAAGGKQLELPLDPYRAGHPPEPIRAVPAAPGRRAPSAAPGESAAAHSTATERTSGGPTRAALRPVQGQQGEPQRPVPAAAGRRAPNSRAQARAHSATGDTASSRTARGTAVAAAAGPAQASQATDHAGRQPATATGAAESQARR